MRLSLNGFLLRDGLSPVGSVSGLAASEIRFSRWADGGLLDLEDEGADPSSGDVIVGLFRRPSSLPAWQTFIRDVVGAEGFDAGSLSLGAIIYCAVAISDPQPEHIRWVAWCFGAGSRILRRAASDHRFGLLIALNLLVAREDSSARPPRLRNLQYRVTAPYFQQAGHRAARDTPVEGFRMNTDSDLLSAAGGHTSDGVFADVLGGRSMKFRAEINAVDDFVTISQAAIDLFRQLDYKGSFKWVDNITPVYDEETIQSLRERLADEMTTDPVPGYLDVLIPDDLVSLDDDRSIQYIAYPGERVTKASRTILTAEMVANLVKRIETDEPGTSLDSQLRFLDSARESLGTASILECICGELVVEGENFVAYDGDFYRVDRSFIERIDAEIESVSLSTLALPCYQGGSEGSYTDRLRNEYPGEFAVLDRALIRLPGESPVEACDLIDREVRLVHLKRKGKSSVFSHLCFQASNSCQLLRRSEEAREQLVSLVRESGAASTLVDEALGRLAALGQSAEFEVVFGILGKWANRGLKNLPLHSKISLMQTVRRVTELGFVAKAALVDVCP